MKGIKQKSGVIGSAVLTLFVLSACGGGSDSSLPPQPVVVAPTAPPTINGAKAFNSPLVRAGSTRFSRYLKNGVYSTHQNGPIVSVDTGSPEFRQGGEKGQFSTTNTQETDVDEADRVEYDGEFMYVAGYPEWHKGETHEASLRVLQRQQDFSLQDVAKHQVSFKGANIHGLYLHQNRLAMVANDASIIGISRIIPQPHQENKPTVQVTLFDTTDAKNMSTLAEMQIEGRLLSSRRTGEYLYLITSHTASVKGLKVAASTDAQKLANYNAINNTKTSDLMPKLTLGGSAVAMNQPQDCYIPEQATQQDGYAQLVTITRINMQQPDQNQSICLSAMADTLYMSSDNLYLAKEVKTETVIHKISLKQSFDYQATGSVNGTINGRNLPHLRLSDVDDKLRIVATVYDDASQPKHQLYVLKQDGKNLKVEAHLPNKQQPDPIGKPGEDIYAVRFLQDRAYIVTFKRIDPLYVIDLADASSPRVLGSLEIPGYSSYLHPVGKNYLLGIGQEVKENTIAKTGTVAIEPPVITAGMKVSLFDISDPALPKELHTMVVKDGFTPVEYDYRALSVLERDGTYQFALPVERWVAAEKKDQPSRSHNSLALIEVADTQSNPTMRQVHQVVVDNKASNTYVFSGNDRSVMHNEHVYYIHGNQVWHSQWQKGATINGPY